MADWTERIEKIIMPVLVSNDCELVTAEWKTHAGQRILQITIDAERGVDLDLCATVSRAAGVLLEFEDEPSGSFVLEVSSPGINRRLVRLQDFRRFVGEKAKIRLRTPLAGGRRRMAGRIEKVTDEDHIVINADDGSIFDLNYDDIAKANLDRI